MITGVNISAPGLDKWHWDAKRLDADIDKVAMSRAFEKIKKLFWRYEAQTFSSSGAVTKSGKWKALSPAYRKWKRKHFPGRGIMVLHGALRSSLTGRSGAIATFGHRSKGWYLKLGTHVTADGFDYPSYHQEKGGRKVIDPTNRELKSWLKPIQFEIMRTARKHKTFVDEVKAAPRARWDRKRV
jgi:hypothetical protein